MDRPRAIPLCAPYLEGDERHYLSECLTSTFVSSVGPFVGRFEEAFGASVGARYAVACASGTAAIHLALQVLGVGRGDVVLVSDFTFIATVNPVTYLGAEPILIDSDRNSWNMDPHLLGIALEDLKRQGTKPKAVLVAHILGQPADIGPILELCQAYDVPLIEDAAESLGGRYTSDYPNADCRNKQVGTIGRIGCFSFNGNKLITCGGGGMVTTDDPELARRVKHLSTQAKLPGVAYLHDEIGYNYRLTNLAAALGLAQLEKLPELLRKKLEIAMRYRELHQNLAWKAQPVLAGTSSSYWLASVVVPSERNALMNHLEARGVQTRPLWAPVSLQAPYRRYRKYGSGVGQWLFENGLSLPSSCGLTQEEQTFVMDEVEAWTKRGMASQVC
jgi:dTDP-4-amino-4,6-dideoxygalactose transaminase